MSKVCAHCDKKLTGCSCGWRGTSDGKLVHKNCKEDYENSINNKERTCAYCKKPFIGDPYFKTDNGAYVHFPCQFKYKNKLNKEE